MDLSSLIGVGAKRQEQLAKMDINCVEDILSYVPVSYRDMTRFSLLQEVGEGDFGLFQVRITSTPQLRRIKKNFSMVTCDIEDISGRCKAVWFNQPYMQKNIQSFTTVLLYGRIQIKQGRRQVMNPGIENGDELGIVPVYRLSTTGGINQKTMRQLMKQAITLCNAQQKELFSANFRTAHQLAERNFAIENIHFPHDFDALDAAKRRLAFEEMLLIQLFIRMRRKVNTDKKGKAFAFSSAQRESFQQLLPFALTKAQQRCCDEILKDLTSGKAMNRMLQGDVGSGKTAVAALAMYAAVQNGGQAALMAPTDILATQHYHELCNVFGSEQVTLLSGSLTAKEQRESLKSIQGGTAKYIIGTHALVQERVEFENLLLVITDEQHRFGVAQRARLSAKGEAPHTLVMSATPIPRTLTLILFGDLDISIIDELPPGRQRVSTHIIPRQKEQDMFTYIKKSILSGQQAYFVCPLIEDSEEVPARSAENLYEILKDGVFADIPIALMHGRLSGNEKNAIMQGFVNNEIKALVSTTVIEVGVNVPNATIMVIDGAERFGLAQLHQLRGRVGRGKIKSYCFLLTDSDNPTVTERLNVLTQNHDGFAIAEKDLDLRGPGDYLGKRQSGLAEARFSQALSNTRLLKETQQVLEELFKDQNHEILETLEAYVAVKFNREMKDIIYN